MCVCVCVRERAPSNSNTNSADHGGVCVILALKCEYTQSLVL